MCLIFVVYYGIHLFWFSRHSLNFCMDSCLKWPFHVCFLGMFCMLCFHVVWYHMRNVSVVQASPGIQRRG